MARSSGVPDEVRQFNAFLAREREEEERQRAIRKAEAAKQRAAERVRAVSNDPKASRDQKVEAEHAYRSAVEAWNTAQRGDEPADAGSELGSHPESEAEVPQQDQGTVEVDEPPPGTATEADERA